MNDSTTIPISKYRLHLPNEDKDREYIKEARIFYELNADIFEPLVDKAYELTAAGTEKEREYMEKVWAANSRLRTDYLELRDKVESIRSTAKTKG